jgi:hypothetical protein
MDALGWITQSTRPFLMRRFGKLPKLLYFSGIVAEHPRSRCESQRMCGAWGTPGVWSAGTVGSNQSCGDDGSGRYSDAGSDFHEDGNRNAEMGRILWAM